MPWHVPPLQWRSVLRSPHWRCRFAWDRNGQPTGEWCDRRVRGVPPPRYVFFLREWLVDARHQLEPQHVQAMWQGPVVYDVQAPRVWTSQSSTTPRPILPHMRPAVEGRRLCRRHRRRASHLGEAPADARSRALVAAVAAAAVAANGLYTGIRNVLSAAFWAGPRWDVLVNYHGWASTIAKNSRRRERMFLINAIN